MNFLPSKDTLQKFAKDYDIAPISCEILSDFSTPINTLKKLKKISKHCYILESVTNNEKWGRYTFLGFDPKLELNCVDGVIKINGKIINETNPNQAIRDILNKHKSPSFDYLPSFTGGFVGYFAYDYVKYSGIEFDNLEDENQFKDIDIMLFDKVIAYDNLRQKIILIANISLNDIDTNYEIAKNELLKIANIIKSQDMLETDTGSLQSEFVPKFSETEFCDMVTKAQKHIKNGEIKQIVLSNLLEANFQGSLINTYRILRSINPSPYMFYFSGNDVELAGASPETLVKLENNFLHTFPLAGTRKRGENKAEDDRLEYELLHDEKELDEHNMLIDLGIEDLNKVCKSESVYVKNLHEIVRYSHVMHISSCVCGEIDTKFDALDALLAILPAGTLIGAPKNIASKLINELEKTKRGIYGGAIGYISFTKNMDTCIAIRLAYKKNGKVYVRSGAGIVEKSIPKNEFKECINKAKAVISAINEANNLKD